MPLWATIALFIGSTVLSVVLQRRASKQNTPKPSPVEPPTTEPGKALPVLFGTFRLAGNVIWYGGYRTKDIVQKAQIISITLNKTTVGYRYFVKMAVALCHGPVDDFVDVVAENGRSLQDYGSSQKPHSPFDFGYDTVAAIDPAVSYYGLSVTQSPSGIQLFELYAPNLFGGRKKGGGLVGKARFFYGGTTQVASSYIDDRETTPVPRWPGVTYVVYEDIEWGESPYLEPLYWVLRRFPRMPIGAGVTSGIGGDANGIGLAYEVLTEPRWGALVPPERIDLTGFSDAATTVDGEDLGLSGALSEPQSAEQVLAEIQRHLDCVFYEHWATGQMKVKLVRGDYVAEDLPLVSPANASRCEYDRAEWHETANVVRVAFSNRSRGFETDTVQAMDLASVQAQGREVPHEVSYPWVTREAVALKLAQRDLRAISRPRARATITCDREAVALDPGDAFRLTWPEHALADKVMRVTRVVRGGLGGGAVRVECVEDVFATEASAYATSGVTWTDPAGAQPVSEPEITVERSETDSAATVTVTVIDPSSRLVSVEFRSQVGYQSPSAWAADGSTPYSSTVTKDARYETRIAWRVTYTDQNGDAQTVEGEEVFQPQRRASVIQLSYALNQGTGAYTVTATVPADVTGVRFATSASAPPSEATVQAASLDSSAPFEITGTLAEGATLYVGACGFDGSTNGPAAWVTVQRDGAVAGAASDAQYLVAAAHASLSAERVATDTSTVAWDFGTAGQAKASIPNGGVTPAKLAPGATTPDATKFYRGDGTWQVVSGGGGGGDEFGVGVSFGDGIVGPNTNAEASVHVPVPFELTGDWAMWGPSTITSLMGCEIYHKSTPAAGWTYLTELGMTGVAGDEDVMGGVTLPSFPSGGYVRFRLTAHGTRKTCGVSLKCARL